MYVNLDMVGNGTGLAVNASSSCAALTEYFDTANNRYIHRPMRVISLRVILWPAPQ